MPVHRCSFVRHTGMERTRLQAVTIRLRPYPKCLGGLPIDGYYALKMDAMPLLNHEVGGVTVTLEDDMTKLDPAMKKGATLTLTDRQAELLMQSRYVMDDDRNTQRMRRQQIF